MRVHVKLFASLREAVGSGELDLELPEKATPEDAWHSLASAHPAIAPKRKSLTVAVNRHYAPFSEILSPGDEIVFVPPVSGG